MIKSKKLKSIKSNSFINNIPTSNQFQIEKQFFSFFNDTIPKSVQIITKTGCNSVKYD
jgi:hypothetical protein